MLSGTEKAFINVKQGMLELGLYQDQVHSYQDLLVTDELHMLSHLQDL